MESIAKDRFTHYIICGIDGEEIMWCTDSKVSGYGMAKYLAREIEKNWDDDEED